MFTVFLLDNRIEVKNKVLRPNWLYPFFIIVVDWYIALDGTTEEL